MKNRFLNPVPSMVVATAALALGACSGSSSSQADPNAPTIEILEPKGAVSLAPGDSLTIRYVDNDPNDQAMTDLVAVPASGPEILIADDRPEMDGAEQTVVWDTTGLPIGAFRLEARTDGGGQVAKAEVTVTLIDPNGLPPGTGLLIESAYPYALETLPDGSFVVAGECFDKTVFGSGAGQVVVENPNEAALCLGKYHPDGSVAWVRSSDGFGLIYGIAGFPDGSIVVAGGHTGGFSWGVGDPGELVNTETTGNFIGFISRLSSDGMVEWTRTIPRASGQLASNLCFGVDGGVDGTIAVTGKIQVSALFGAGQANETVLTTPADDAQAFLAVYEGDGTLLRAERLPAQTRSFGFGVQVLPDGGIALAGNATGNLTLAQGQPEQVVLEDSGSRLTFLARYEADGRLGWARKLSDTSSGFGTSLDQFSDGSVVVAVDCENSTLFHEGEPDEFLAEWIVAGEGSLDSIRVVTRYGIDGTVLWHQAVPTDEEGFGTDAVAVGPDDTVLFASYLSVDSEQDALSYPTLENTAALFEDESIVIEFGSDGTPLWARRIRSTDFVEANSVGYLPNGTALAAGYFGEDVTLEFGSAASPLTLTPEIAESSDGIFIGFFGPAPQVAK